MADEVKDGGAAVMDAPAAATPPETSPQIDVGAHFGASDTPSTTAESASATPAPAAAPAKTPTPVEAKAPPEPTEPEGHDETGYDPAKVGKLMGEFEAMLATQRAQALAPQTPPAAPAATPATSTTTPDPFAGIIKAATDEYGAEMAEKVVKPLVDAFQGQIKQLRDSMSPAQAMAAQMAQVAQAHTEQKVHAFLDKFPTVYGKDTKERTSNPVFARAFQEDVQRGALLQDFFASKGRRISDEDALAMAHSARIKEQPASEARQTVVNDLKRRSNQRSAPPAATSGAPSDPVAALQAEVNKHFER